MNILFLTLARIDNIVERGIYTDLMREFINNGHNVYIVTPNERRFNQKTNISSVNNITILKVKTLNIQKTNFFEKGIGLLLIEYQFKKSIIKHFSKTKFDLLLYSTPPITFTNVIKYVKFRDFATTYLLLKDIFPQNAVDLGLFNKNGILYKYFRRKERSLYDVSDFIGCLSPANVNFLLTHNSSINQQTVEINSNSIDPVDNTLTIDEIIHVRNEFNIPLDAIILLYGGNLGIPQGLDFLLEVIESNLYKKNIYFVIVGSGTEYPKIKSWFCKTNPCNAKLLSSLPKAEYDKLAKACDIGLVFLDKRFTIPNYPSRLLSYLENRMPIISATDSNTDVGTIAQENGYGLCCINGDLELMNKHIDTLSSDKSLIKSMGEKGYSYLIENYTTKQTYSIIMKHFNN